MAIQSTDPVSGKPTFNDTSTTQADLQALADWADPTRLAAVTTYAGLPATGWPGQYIEVTSDPTPALNGRYRWTGTAWRHTTPWVSYKGNGTNVPVSGPTYALIDFATYFALDRSTGGFPTPGSNYLFKAPYDGRYGCEVQYRSDDTGLNHILILKKNSVSLDGTNAFVIENYTGVAGVGGRTVRGEIDLATGDQVSLVEWVNSSGSNILRPQLAATFRWLNR